MSSERQAEELFENVVALAQQGQNPETILVLAGKEGAEIRPLLAIAQAAPALPRYHMDAAARYALTANLSDMMKGTAASADSRLPATIPVMPEPHTQNIRNTNNRRPWHWGFFLRFQQVAVAAILIFIVGAVVLAGNLVQQEVPPTVITPAATSTPFVETPTPTTVVNTPVPTTTSQNTSTAVTPVVTENPTATPEPTATALPTSTATNTHKPAYVQPPVRQTTTNRPVATSTPLPIPTNTAIPDPTNTPVPPTNTARPPTDTPKPTNTVAKPTPPPPPPTTDDHGGHDEHDDTPGSGGSGSGSGGSSSGGSGSGDDGGKH